MLFSLGMKYVISPMQMAINRPFEILRPYLVMKLLRFCDVSDDVLFFFSMILRLNDFFYKNGQSALGLPQMYIKNG